MNNDHKIVVLSGSMKYFDQMMEKATELSMNGCIPLLPFKDPRGAENLSDEVKAMYDSQHRQRIHMADSMYVCNVDGYIGKSTRAEIEYAVELGKRIEFMVPLEYQSTKAKNINELGYVGTITICGSMRFYELMVREQTKLVNQGYLVYLPPLDAGEECEHVMCSRIDASDSIFVVNPGGYIGEQTSSNISYAKQQGKEIFYFGGTAESLICKDVIDRIINSKRMIGSKSQLIVTLCGSRKFSQEFDSIFKSLTSNGIIVFTPAIFGYTEEEAEKLTDEEHMKLDDIHKWKIDVADAILIVNPQWADGYVGENTWEEIHYARERGKDIKCLCKTDHTGIPIII